MRDCILKNILQARDKCGFVENNCVDNGIVNLYYINYCLVNEYYFVTLIICIFMLGICFNLLSTTADTYLTP